MTGELLGAPSTYIDRRAADRSGFAQRTAVDDSTGEITDAPDSYEDLGAADRSHFAQATTVDLNGQLTAVPQFYAGLRAFDRSALAQQTTVDETGQVIAVSPSYEDVGGVDRGAQARETTIDADTGGVQAVPGSYPPDFDGDGPFDPSDNCPFFSNPDQADTNGNGRGNACECGDQNLSGFVNVSDLIAINSAIFDPGLVTPLCDGNNDSRCNVSDIVAANIEIFSPTNTSTCERQPVPGP